MMATRKLKGERERFVTATSKPKGGREPFMTATSKLKGGTEPFMTATVPRQWSQSDHCKDEDLMTRFS